MYATVTGKFIFNLFLNNLIVAKISTYPVTLHNCEFEKTFLYQYILNIGIITKKKSPIILPSYYSLSPQYDSW